MKKIKESLYEKFTEESDPIHDLGIGATNFKEKRKELIKYPGYTRNWLDYLNSLRGKKIIGRFQHKRNFATRILSGEKIYKFIIQDNASYSDGKTLYFYDKSDNHYCIIEDEKYFLS
jgi:hypothetical protein